MQEPRFLCDEMLGRLARYLRAAGYDTLLAADSAADPVLLARALRERRVFVTCDRRIAERRAAAGVAVVLPMGRLDEHARVLASRAGVDWLHRPFTRCLVDNTLLLSIGDATRAAVPADVSLTHARHCPQCRRSYWPGSHHRRMRARLRAWSEGRFDASA